MSKKNSTYPWLVVSDGDGNIFEIPGIQMAGMMLSEPVKPERSSLIALPYGSDLFTLPGRVPYELSIGRASVTASTGASSR